MVRFRPKRSSKPALDSPGPSGHGQGAHPAVYVERATKVYNEGTPEALVALEEITMRVEQGEVVALLGPSGCGKSTLLKMIGGLYPATAGRIFVDGVQVTEPGEMTGMMFQKPVLFPWLKVVDNVLLPVRTQGAKRSEFLDRANDLIALAGLSGFGQRYPWELSGGMQQRVAICRMLMGEPKVLLLDEPFGALDEMTREYMDLELRRIIIQQNRSALLVTHNPLEAAFIGDRVVVMTPRPGKIAGEVEVPLGRDRSEGLLASDELNVYIREARSLLELAKDSLL
ncbi:MAG: ABC transporter ATP-binding protein [Acidimicrobiia bacterium]|nr:ABC transporter ATP-binding protein [Acidimicrobiia bacterium]